MMFEKYRKVPVRKIGIMAFAVLLFLASISSGFQKPRTLAENFSFLRLVNTAHDAEEKGDLALASRLGEEILEKDKICYGESSIKLTLTLNWLARLYEQQELWKKAIQRSEAVTSLLEEEYGETDWRTIDARLATEHLELRSKLTKAHREELTRARELKKLYFSELHSGNLEAAIEAIESAVSIEQEILGEDHPTYGVTLGNFGFILQTTGDFSRGERLYFQSAEIARKSLGENHPDYGAAIGNLAELYVKTGEYGRAKPLFEQAIAIQKNANGEQHIDYVTPVNNLAECCRRMGDYDRARQLWLQCLEIHRKLPGGRSSSEYAVTLSNLGATHQAMGDFDRAEQVFLECLKNLSKPNAVTSLQDRLRYATAANNLGELYKSKGNYPSAEPLLRESKEIIGKAVGEETAEYAMLLNNLGALYLAMGDYVRAEPALLQCKKIRQDVLALEHPDYAQVLNNLGILYKSMGDYERAESFYLQCKEVQRKVLGEKHADYATTLSNLATLYEEMGEYGQAEMLFLECKEVQQKAIGTKHVHYARTLNNLAGLYNLMGDYERAEPLYSQSVALYQNVYGEQHPDYAISLNNLGALYFDTKDFARGEPLIRQSLAITRNHIRATSTILSERQQLAMTQTLRYLLDSYLSLAIEEGKTFHVSAAREVLVWKGATLARQRAMRLAADDPAIAEQFKQLQAVSRKLAALSRAAPDSEREQWSQQVRELTSSKEALESELSQKSAVFRDALKTITPELIQAAVPENGVLVDFLLYNKFSPSKENEVDGLVTPSLLAVIVKREGEPQLVDLGSKAPLAEAIDQWRQTFGMSPEGKRAGLAIRNQIWKPLLKHIDDFDTVLVSTDGVLGRLPIGALPGKQTGSYLIEDHRIALVPVPQLLPALVNPQGASSLDRELLLLGDVNYDAVSDAAPEEKRKKRRPGGRRSDGVDREFDRLDGAAGEVAAIQVLYQELYEADSNDVGTLKKSEASEAAFRALAGKYRVLHLATHGFFASANLQSGMNSEAVIRSGRKGFASTATEVVGLNPGLLSGLAFAGANLEPELGKDDGILTAQEITFLPLNGVETVVLSACETGLGEVAGGEGLIGIQRAFQIAGVKTTVASLWKVNDQATRVLMERFYRNLWEKEMSHLDALREAQLYILNNPNSVRSLDVDSGNKEKRASPELWAAFQISGDWR